MAYTTNQLVRDESGFTNNTDLTEATLTSYVSMAHGAVVGFVARIYDATKLSTNFTNSQAEAYLQSVETLWASGLLLIKEYGAEAQDSDKNGYTKLNLAKSMLQDLEDEKIVLLDSNNAEYDRGSTNVGGKISATGAVEGDNIFDVNDVF
jgi:hypothetical protein